MADIDDEGLNKRSRKLPPLKPEEAPVEEKSPEEKKPRRKKKKLLEENGDVTATVTDNTETPRKKKRKPRETKEPAGGAGDDAATLESTQPEDETPRKKTRRKKKPVDEQMESAQSPDDQGPAQGDEGTEKLVKKKRKKRKTPREESAPETTQQGTFNEGLAAELHDLEEDVIDADSREDLADEDEGEESAHALSHKGLQSQPGKTLYIEKKHGFLREDKQKLARRLAEEEQRRKESANLVLQPSEDTLQFALTTHRIFRKLALFCHGILAGGALVHCVMVFMMVLYQDLDIFLSLYARASMPIHEIYYLLFVVCTVSACDRFDLAGMTRSYFVKCITLQNGSVSALVYLAGTVVSLSIVQYDDKIYYYPANLSEWQDAEVSKSILNDWSIVNAVRAGAAVLGWLIIGLQPSVDKLKSNLLSGDENLLGEDKRPLEMKSRISAA